MKWQTADSLQYELLRENARTNRRFMTEAESAFWSQVKCSALGQKCRRQYVIGQYIVDFFFRESMLIVEIDGGYHLEPSQQLADAERQSWLQDQGYRVLRFSNEQVLFDIKNTLEIIKTNLTLSTLQEKREGHKL